jgi:hypothetical protein
LHADEVNDRATRRLGELTRAQRAKEGLNQGSIKGKIARKGRAVLDPRPTLKSQGVSHDLFARAQRLAEVQP